MGRTATPKEAPLIRVTHVRITPPPYFTAMPDVLQLTPDEVRLEQARQLSIRLDLPTRVRGTKVEVLVGDVWAEASD